MRTSSCLFPLAKTALLVLVAGAVASCAKSAPGPQAQLSYTEQNFLSGLKRITTEGRRAGEGYFNADGSEIVFQSEREQDNPFYQIYTYNLETEDLKRVSPGHGKTTCAWIHPSGEKVLFASTHLDPKVHEKEAHEFAERAAGNQRRYQWDYDENYDIFEAAPDGSGLKNLTHTRGYDAEGNYSPDGKWIVFASNRAAYSRDLSAADKAQLAKDPSYFMDLYIMNADGTDVKRLTKEPGYDGGPFFSADGSKIVWRRFSTDGRAAEVYTMNADGTGEQQVTRMGNLSWAPFFHPSGDYIIFASNKEGHGNFELYLVDSRGKQEPVRVTDTMGFDGLPVFSPDGKNLLWTTSRTPDKSSQLFLSQWSDEAARRALSLH